MTLVTQGPAAAWEKLQEGLTNLREMVMEQIMTFVRDRVVNRAIQTLVTSLNPAGAFIQAVIAIYNTIMFFVERLRQIAQVAMSFIDSISAIAGGVIATAANRVEQTMAGLLTLVISFLARLAGLGRVGDAVVGIINRVRAPIDRALDRVVDWIVAQARRLGRFVASGARAVAGALRSLTGRGATLPRVAPAVLAEVQRTPAGTVLFQGRSAAGPAQVQSILQSRPGARFDDASGVLALPPVNGDALASAPSLRAMAQQLAQQTGVTRVTLARSGQRWALDGHINPTLAGLAQHVAGNALDPLLDDIRRESDRISPQKEPLMAICRERAARHRAAVAFRVVPRSRTVAEERTYVDFSIPGASPAVTFSTYIVTTGDAVCPSCGAAAGVSRPHNVIPGRMWRDAVETGFRGFGVVKPYDNWAGFIESVGDSRADSAVSPTEDRQCDQCERNQDKQPIPHSLIQRRRAVAAGYLITLRAGAPAGSTTGQAFVGQQYGEPGGPSSMNDAQVWELTRIKIDQVLEEMGNRLNMAPTGAATPRPNTSPVYTNIV
ncbi:MAG TPA: hypothetical protein VK689_07985, partial [Armatimonadota bacterium]|nr:hypothetical protein [Armatimonadota bacterium]